ncbi:MAG: aminotransferase class IV [Alicyclobacillus sp.]|nr:aminotransferase class IV [Alicyclobacillus sp.]
MPTVVYYNGEFLEAGAKALPVEERGHQFGDGVYEVVRVYGGRPFLLDWHLERLERSLAMVEIRNPFSREAWVDLIHEAIRRSGEAEATVYFHVTRGIAPRNHVFPQTDPVVSLVARAVSSVAGTTAVRTDEVPTGRLVAWPDERWANAFVKTINLLPNVIAKEAAHRVGAREALLVRAGVITECAGSNVLFVRGGELWTHPANRFILGGITRRFILQLADQLQIPVREEAVTLDDLGAVDEVFISGTTTEIVPIGQIVVHASQQDALRALPADAPPSLLDLTGPLQTVWQAKGPAPVTSRLNQAFTEAIQELRAGAFVG